MKAVLKIIRILVITLLVNIARCQDGFSDQDILRIQKRAPNEGDIESITSYSTNIIQRDPNSQSISSVSVQYHLTDEPNHEEQYPRADRTRSRKVYRIKNPFQQQLEENGQQYDTDTQDSGTGASNQYAAVQYSLPPEDFLQQMRDNQYYQQQQQISTPAPNLGYTATPQPQYQFSTITSSNYDNHNLQLNQIPQLEAKASHGQSYLSTPNSFQFNPQNTFSFDSVSTPSSVTPYLSTSLPNNNHFVGTPANSYVSSSSPIYLSSPSNLQTYVSSPLPNIQAVSSDYGNNRATTTIGSNSLSYDNNDHNKKMQIDHYDNSANGIRYPINIQQQFSNDYVSSTVSPISSPYPDTIRDTWQNSMNALSKSLQEVSMGQYQNYPYNNQETRTEFNNNNANSDNVNSDTHRVGNMPSANNIYLNYMQPDSQTYNNPKSRTRDLERETGQAQYYSNGDYGWRLSGKKPMADIFSSGNHQRYQSISQSDGAAVSQMNFHMDTSRPYDQNSKSGVESKEAQEFAKAAAKAQENYKQQQMYANNYASNFNNNNNQLTTYNGYPFYGNNEKQKNKYTDNSNSNVYMYSSSQPDLITASPYYYDNSRENTIDSKTKQPFDHAKALKNIVPIDVSNVVSNSDSQPKVNELEENRYDIQFNKDQDQSLRSYYRPVADAYYKDKNSIYGFNIKNKPENYFSTDGPKQLEQNTYYGKQQNSEESNYNQGSHSATSQPFNFISQLSNNYQDNIQSSANIQQQGLQRPQSQMQSDFASILKLNDIPYRLTQGLTSDALRLHNSNFDQGVIPTPLPVRLNQNVGSHQLDVTNVLNKLMLNKQPALNVNRPEMDSQASGLLSTINGYKVANPFNVDLKLVAELLKSKPAVDDMMTLRDQFSKPAPLKLDLSQLQLLLKNENNGNLAPLNDALGALSSPYLDMYNNGRFPYQGVKYSRSQEEEESIIPIADASNNHPIGAVIEQDDPENTRDVGITDLTAHGEDNLATSFDDTRSKNSYIHSHREIGDRRHPNSLLSGRHHYQRKYPKSDVEEPYPLLKPPPRTSRVRSRGKMERNGRRRRLNKPKIVRFLKTEPLFEADSDGDNMESVPILLRPPHPIAEAKSDTVNVERGA